MISPDLIVSMPHGGQRPIIVRGPMISVADARHLAIKQLRTAYTEYHVDASSKVSTSFTHSAVDVVSHNFYVFRCRRGIAKPYMCELGNEIRGWQQLFLGRFSWKWSDIQDDY